jgi:L-fuculose-phosphate aldolase
MCREVGVRGLAGPLTSGNASLRVGEGLLITPSAVAFDQITKSELVLVGAEPSDDRTGEAGAALPTSELALHRRAHAAAEAELRVVLHVHAPWTVAASVLELSELPLVHYHQALLGDGPTPVVPFATPGSGELASALGVALTPTLRAVVLANHGAVVLGATGEEALQHAEVLEDVCRLVVLAGGRERSLTSAQLRDARTLFERYGSGR